MDLSKLDTVKGSEEGRDLVLINPLDGEPLLDDKTKEPISIRLIGRDSKLYQSEQHKIADKRINRRLAAPGASLKLSTEEMQKDGLDVLVKCTRGWNHIVLGGEELLFSEENVRRVYDSIPWVREQVDAFISNRANFLGN